jgi:drug/metabolite transporter (DMT)-like permease
MNLALVYILISVSAGAVGQILLKQGMRVMGTVTLLPGELPGLVLKIITSPYLVLGLALYVGATLFWLAALSRVELSFAYPFVSLSYVVMLLASWQLFQEDLSAVRLIGTLVIILGVFMISRS